MKHAVILSLLIGLAPARTWGQDAARTQTSVAVTSVREALPEDARGKFDEGSALYKGARYPEAREAFEAAYSASQDPRVLFNLAVCDKAMGRYARAIVTLRRSLSAQDDRLTPDYADRTREAIGTLSRYVAFVTVVSTVPNARVTVDGEPADENPVPLDAGQHAIVVSKDGYEPASTAMTVRAGDVERVLLSPVPRAVVLAVPANPARARLRVTTNRATDVVHVDGHAAGRSGVEVNLLPGEHRVLIDRGGGDARAIDVLLHDNETRDLRVTLEEKSNVSPWWWVGGAVVLGGAVAATAAALAQPTRFQGDGAGSLPPFVAPAAWNGGLR